MAAAEYIIDNSLGRLFSTPARTIPHYHQVAAAALASAEQSMEATRVGRDAYFSMEPAWTGTISSSPADGRPLVVDAGIADLLIVYGEAHHGVDLSEIRAATLFEDVVTNSKSFAGPSAMNSGERVALQRSLSFSAGAAYSIVVPDEAEMDIQSGAGAIVAICIDADGIVYALAAGDAGGGAYTLSLLIHDGGLWVEVALGDYAAATSHSILALDGTLYLAIADSVYRMPAAVHAGQQRHMPMQIPDAPAGSCYLFEMSGRAIAVSATGVISVLNRSGPARQIAQLPSVSGAVVGRADGEMLWAATATRLLIFAVTGEFSAVTLPGGQAPVYLRCGIGNEMLAYSANGNSYYSDDYGENWSAHTAFVGTPKRVIYANRSFVYLVQTVNGEDRLYQSVDGGASWVETRTPGGDQISILCGVPLPSGGVTWAGRIGAGGVAAGATGVILSTPEALTKQAIARL